MACHLFDPEPLSEPMLSYCQLDPQGHYCNEILFQIQNFIQGTAPENVVCEMAAILSWLQCAN